MNKEYITSLNNWCDELLTFIHQGNEERLDLFTEEIRELKEDLAKDLTEEDEQDICNRAKSLSSQIREVIGTDRNNTSRIVKIGEHQLPPLPYSYSALEPYIDREIMRLHHDKHHKSYVDGLNKAEKEMEKARKTNDFSFLKHWEREAAFHGAGHYLHTIFWTIMSPNGGGKPTGDLAKLIDLSFGSFDRFKNHFNEAAKQVEGVGWAILVWVPRTKRLEILQAEKHQNLSQQDVIPILVLDVWEHAYYLQYKNKREDYIKNWWNVVNWNEVSRRLNTARKVMWESF
ncbi:superoxide dismutase [Metabacillus fastidiosus]|uniref:superoxide dismutase n=1 Tax=Metabacillus fastidiosus TaxID=1458 RepID=UPI000B1FBB82|nr:superoxide dismutase [Metabacillus fastidiosus]MED4462644.1 superoxide dismutase [Metabacillus fastidiosus]